MQVSVILPVYNRQKSGECSIRSVLEQDFTDFELIIVDDFSSPAFQLPPDIAKDRRVVLLRHMTNQGAGAARNTGLARAKGRYVAFIDSDDLWRKKKLGAQLSFAEQNRQLPGRPLAAYVCGFTLKSSPTRRKRTLLPLGSEKLIDFASGCWFGPGSTALISRDVFDRVGKFDANLRRLEDIDWFIRFARSGGALYTVPKIYVDISSGAKPGEQMVRESSDYLLKKYDGRTGNDLLLAPKVLRHLKSYLALVRASAYGANRGLSAGFLRQLLISWLLKPRLTLQLNNWWLFVTDEEAGSDQRP